MQVRRTVHRKRASNMSREPKKEHRSERGRMAIKMRIQAFSARAEGVRGNRSHLLELRTTANLGQRSVASWIPGRVA